MEIDKVNIDYNTSGLNDSNTNEKVTARMLHPLVEMASCDVSTYYEGLNGKYLLVNPNNYNEVDLQTFPHVFVSCHKCLESDNDYIPTFSTNPVGIMKRLNPNGNINTDKFEFTNNI